MVPFFSFMKTNFIAIDSVMVWGHFLFISQVLSSCVIFAFHFPSLFSSQLFSAHTWVLPSLFYSLSVFLLVLVRLRFLLVCPLCSSYCSPSQSMYISFHVSNYRKYNSHLLRMLPSYTATFCSRQLSLSQHISGFFNLCFSAQTQTSHIHYLYKLLMRMPVCIWKILSV